MCVSVLYIYYILDQYIDTHREPLLSDHAGGNALRLRGGHPQQLAELRKVIVLVNPKLYTLNLM